MQLKQEEANRSTEHSTIQREMARQQESYKGDMEQLKLLDGQITDKIADMMKLEIETRLNSDMSIFYLQ